MRYFVRLALLPLLVFASFASAAVHCCASNDVGSSQQISSQVMDMAMDSMPCHEESKQDTSSASDHNCQCGHCVVLELSTDLVPDSMAFDRAERSPLRIGDVTYTPSLFFQPPRHTLV